MNDHYSGLCEALSLISASSTSSSIWSTLKEFGARFGYSYLLGVDAAKLAGGIRESTIYSDAPATLLAELDKNMSLGQHPYIVCALRAPVPFLVSDLRANPEFAGQPWINFLSDIVRDGEGLVLPVYRDKELVACFVFGGMKPETSAMARSSLQVACHSAFEKLVDLRDRKTVPSASALTVRETQCLRYIASGHEDEEISQMLGISPRTVRFHVDSAKNKLSVGSRVQAVTKALRERIIAV